MKKKIPNELAKDINDLSGKSMSDVKVHYNSSKPTQLSTSDYGQAEPDDIQIDKSEDSLVTMRLKAKPSGHQTH